MAERHTYEKTLLFDFYGRLLTPRQQEVYDLYYNEDLSLAEIGENLGISRQGVRDLLQRGEAILTDIEEKTGLISRFLSLRETARRLETGLNRLHTLNESRWHNAQLAQLTAELRLAVSALSSEKE